MPHHEHDILVILIIIMIHYIYINRDRRTRPGLVLLNFGPHSRPVLTGIMPTFSVPVVNQIRGDCMIEKEQFKADLNISPHVPINHDVTIPIVLNKIYTFYIDKKKKKNRGDCVYLLSKLNKLKYISFVLSVVWQDRATAVPCSLGAGHDPCLDNYTMLCRA